MQRLMKVPALQITETRGNPVTTFNRQTTPIGRAVQVRLPGAGFIWHRPVAVEVREEDSMYRLPITDITLRATSAMLLTGLAVVLVSLSVRRILLRRRKTS